MFALFHYFFHSCLRAKNQFVFERCSCSSSSRPSSIMQFKLHSKNIAIKIIMYIWLIVFWNRALYAQFFDVNLLGEMQWNSIERKVCICRIQLIPIDWLNRECPTENGLSNNWCVSEVVEEKCSVLNWKKVILTDVRFDRLLKKWRYWARTNSSNQMITDVEERMNNISVTLYSSKQHQASIVRITCDNNHYAASQSSVGRCEQPELFMFQNITHGYIVSVVRSHRTTENKDLKPVSHIISFNYIIFCHWKEREWLWVCVVLCVIRPPTQMSNAWHPFMENELPPTDRVYTPVNPHWGN